MGNLNLPRFMCEQVDEKRTECSPFIKSPGLSNIHSARGGGYFRNFGVGMCRWDPGTLNLYQS